jgi:hypothetical protein
MPLTGGRLLGILCRQPTSSISLGCQEHLLMAASSNQRRILLGAASLEKAVPNWKICS